jgi:hypothetical protein
MKSPGSRKLKEHDVILSCFPFLGRWLFFKTPRFSTWTKGKGTHYGEEENFPCWEFLSPYRLRRISERNPLHSEEKKRKKIEIGREVFVFAAHVDRSTCLKERQLLY